MTTKMWVIADGNGVVQHDIINPNEDAAWWSLYMKDWTWATHEDDAHHMEEIKLSKQKLGYKAIEITIET